jgi:hypothetical protein
MRTKSGFDRSVGNRSDDSNGVGVIRRVSGMLETMRRERESFKISSVNDIEEERGIILLVFSGNLQGFLYLKIVGTYKENTRGNNRR